MKKQILLLAMCGLLSSQTKAQRSLEYGVNLGFSSYLGDLQTRDVTISQVSSGGGVFAKYNFNPFVSVKSFMNFGRIKAADENSREQGLRNRNLSFRSNIFELGAALELSIIPFGWHQENKKDESYYRFAPYISAGLNMFHFNPQTKYKGNWVDLQPLRTEGQGQGTVNVNQYALTQFAIPVGLGIKYQINSRFVLGFELGLRKTFTDYLDDVSGVYANSANQSTLSAELAYRGDELPDWNGVYYPAAGAKRGDKLDKDWYLMNMFSMSYKLNKRREGKGFYSNK